MMRSVELFTGAGGLALGLHRAGFHHRAVIERDHDACATLRLNRQRQLVTGIGWDVLEADVTTFDYAGLGADGLDVLAGGPPCQPFSLGGKHAGDADARSLFPEAIRAVRELRPRAFFFENVRGLVRESFLPYFSYIQDQLRFPLLGPSLHEDWTQHATRLHAAGLERGGQPADVDCQYDVWSRLYNVADFGIPQERHRIFIVGFRRDLGVPWHFLEPTHSHEALLWDQYVDGSYWREYGLTRPTPPAHLASRISRLSRQPRPMTRRWRTVRDAIGDLPEPRDFIPYPLYNNHIGIPDARSYPGHTGSPWDWPAKAIKAGDHGNPGGENMLRREDGSVRYFTVRELARLQTFPDAWWFARSWSESRRQLGNAAPVQMAEMIAQRIYQALESVDRKAGALVSRQIIDDRLNQGSDRRPFPAVSAGQLRDPACHVRSVA